MNDKLILTESDLALMLDQLLARETGERWDGFYENRAKPCPFFVEYPDENLYGWANQGKFSFGKALEIGCGNGRNSIFLAQHGFEVTAIDFSQKAIDWARERAEDAEVQLDLMCQSIFEAELQKGGFDLIYDSGCFHHIPPHRRRQYCEIVANAIRPGGWFGLTCFRPEGGSGLTDFQVYEQRSMGGGLGYLEEQLREIWSQYFDIKEIRPMEKQSSEAKLFGEDFLWVMLGTKF